MPHPVLDAPVSPLRHRLIDYMNMRRFGSGGVAALSAPLGVGGSSFDVSAFSVGEAHSRPSCRARLTALAPKSGGVPHWTHGVPRSFPLRLCG